MACTDCYPGNSTVVVGENPVTVTGSGTVGDPYVVGMSGNLQGDFAQAFQYDANPNIDLSAFTRPTSILATLTDDVTVTLPSWSTQTSGTMVLTLTQGGAGGHVLSLPGTLSSAPIVLSTAAGATDVVTLFWTGADWIALMTALDVA